MSSTKGQIPSTSTLSFWYERALFQRKPSKEAIEEGQRRRRIEEILEARLLRREFERDLLSQNIPESQD